MKMIFYDTTLYLQYFLGLVFKLCIQLVNPINGQILF